MLLARGANVNARASNNETALMGAANMHDNTDVANALIAAGEILHMMLLVPSPQKLK